MPLIGGRHLVGRGVPGKSKQRVWGLGSPWAPDLEGATEVRDCISSVPPSLLVSPALDVLVLLHYNTHIICTIGVKVAQVYLKYANPNITMLRKQEHLSWFGSS